MGSGFRSFAFGEVLTSANVQNYLMDQAVTVFAGTAARGSAIASPETGMVSYRTDGTADSKREGFEFYDGSAWTRLIPAGAGLTLISSTTIGSAVSSVTVSGAFSSTYDNYKIIISGGAGSTSLNLTMILGATATGYYAGYNQVTYSSGSTTNTAADNNATSWTRVASVNTGGICASFDLLAPNLAKNTVIMGSAPNVDTSGNSRNFAGFLNDTTAYTAFTLTTSTGTITGGTIKVYGYQN